MVCGRGAAGWPVGRPAGRPTEEICAWLRPARSRVGLGWFGARVLAGRERLAVLLWFDPQKFGFWKFLCKERIQWDSMALMGVEWQGKRKSNVRNLNLKSQIEKETRFNESRFFKIKKNFKIKIL